MWGWAEKAVGKCVWDTLPKIENMFKTKGGEEYDWLAPARQPLGSLSQRPPPHLAPRW